MLDKIINILPEIPLIVGIIHLCALYLLGNEKAKVYASVSRFWLLVSVFLTTICYYQRNSSVFSASNSYTLLFILCADIALYIIMILSASWFSSLKRTGGRYYILLLLSSGLVNMMLNNVNFYIYGLCFAFLTVVGMALYAIHTTQQHIHLKKYIITSVLVLIILAIGIIYAGQIAGSSGLSAGEVQLFLRANSRKIYTNLFVISLIVPLLYGLGIFPFHGMAEDKACCSILPVSHYFMLFLPVVYFGCLIKINQIISPVYATTWNQIYQVLALVSVIWGAIGANTRKNLHGVYAYSSIYYFGIILFLISLGKEEAIFAAFIYLLCYLLVLANLYAIFYNLKTHGQYISDINSLSGLAQTRPYTTGALLISLFSLIGIPPLIGFLGQLSMADELLGNGNYIAVGIIFAALLFLSKAYLEIMKVIYFAPKTKSFDSESKYVLFYTIINTFIIMSFAFNPSNIIEKIKDMFYVVFL